MINVHPVNQFDFRIYYDFAKWGNRYGWIYRDWTAIFWYPFTLLQFPTAYFVWYMLSAMFVLIMVKKLLEVNCGWVLLYPYLKVVSWTLGSGNILPILATLSLYPAGVIFSSLIKPNLLVIWFVHIVKKCYSAYRDMVKPKLQIITLGVIFIVVCGLVLLVSIPLPNSYVMQHLNRFVLRSFDAPYLVVIYIILRRGNEKA